MRALPALS
jgi:hypothetical protein